MHKCGYHGCQEQVDDRYRFCWAHRKTPYIDICKIHGKQTFVEGQCQECKKLKRGVYRIYKRNGKYYFNRNKKALPANYFMKPFYPILVNREIPFHAGYIKSIIQGPGIYGIFERDKTKKNQLGRCLYIGQSVHIKTRKDQHHKQIVAASNQLKGVRAKAKKADKNKSWKKLISRDRYKVEKKYYDLAEYGLKNIKFVTLYAIPKTIWNRLTFEEQKTCLTFLEQNFIDTYKPKLNTFAPRNSVL